MQKTVMVFGAGINQMTLIEAVNELGHRSLVVDPSPSPPGKAKADVFIQIPKDDYEATKQAAIKYNVAGIVTGQMENPLKMMARLAKEMGYIFHSPEVIVRSTNKFLMKQEFLKHGISCAKGRLSTDSRILSQEEIEKYAYPIIIKPLSAFSSRGVFRIDSYRDYLDKIAVTLDFSDDGSYLIEEFIDGPEYSVETITYQGMTTIIQYTEKKITPYPETVEIGHLQPAALTMEQKNIIDTTVKIAIKSLGIDNSAAHTELKLTAQGPVIIEIGPRLGGDFISSYLTQISTGCNMDAAAVNVALGHSPELNICSNAGSAIVYLSLPKGNVVKAILDSTDITQEQYYVMHSLSIKPGDCIMEITDSSKRPGFVITSGETRQQAYSNALELAKRLTQTIIVES